MSETEGRPDHDMAYVAVINPAGECRLGIAKRGESGYYTTRDGTTAGGTFEDYPEARKAAVAFNERLGLTPKQAALIVASSMRRG